MDGMRGRDCSLACHIFIGDAGFLFDMMSDDQFNLILPMVGGDRGFSHGILSN
jgi:hypothetical protein